MVKRILKSAALLLLAVGAGCGNGPDTPKNLVATSGADSASLRWDAVGDEKEEESVTYNVYRGTAAGSINSKTKIASDLSATTYTDTAVTPGSTYYYQVTAWNAKGESAASNEVKVTIGSLPAPAVLTATVSGGDVNLAWSAVSGATGYNVYRGTTQTGTLAAKARIATGVAATTYSDTTATPGVTYYYQVTATNATGESSGSDEVSATP